MKFRVVILIFILSTTSVTSLFGQESIRVMCYNLLNFPLGDMPSREDTLDVILKYYQPDLLMMQELKASFGLNAALSSLNELDMDEYRSSTFIAQQSGGGGGLQQAIVYNNRIFGLSNEDVILTPVRDVNYFKLFLRSANLAENADTIFVHVFVTHLKSSTGSTNEAQRLQSVNAFLPYLNDLNDNDRVIFAGDLNLYSSSEPAYQALLNSANSPALFDPIDSPGNWTSSSYPLKQIHTQSTRTTSVFGDGSTGGVDDRFDFILCSESLLNQSGELHYTEETYRTLGNSGQCYNQSSFACAASNGLPAAVTSAIYYQSDHFPVVMELETSLSLGVPNELSSPSFKLFNNQHGSLSLVTDQMINGLQLYDISGRVVTQFNQLFNPGTHFLNHNLKPGIYIVTALNGSKGSSIKLVIQ